MSRKKKEKVDVVETPELLTATPEETIITEVPPVIDETAAETAELLLEVPPVPVEEPLLEKYINEAPVETISNTFSGEYAAAPNPRQPRAVPRPKFDSSSISLESLTPKQKKALLGGFSKKTLAGRFGIKP